MKVKALGTFISGRVSGKTGDIIDNISNSKAERLAALGFVEIMDEPDDKKPAEKEKSAKSAKSSGKAAGKK